MPDIVIAFFALGVCTGLLKSDLKVPDPVLIGLPLYEKWVQLLY